MFYCPTQTERTSPRLAHNSRVNRWRINTGSVMAPKYEPPAGLSSSFNTRPPNGARWSLRHYSNKVIYTDFVGVKVWPDSTRFPGGLLAPHQGRGYNRLVGDGSVSWVQTRRIEHLQPITNVSPSRDGQRSYYELMDVLP
jgi:hypothetical protein